MPFPQTGFLDQFNRPDEGPPPTGWTSETGSAKGHIVSSNALLPSDNTTQCASTWNTSFNADQEAYMDLTGMIPQDAAFSLVLRANGQAPMFDNNVFYSVRFTRITGASNDTVDFFSWSSGTPTAIGSATTLTSDLQNTDQLGARIVGNTLTAWKNGVQQATQTDSAITGGGFVGIYHDPNTGTVLVMNNFGGGSLDVGGGVTGDDDGDSFQIRQAV